MREIRRKDRIWEDQTEVNQLLEMGEYGFLAMVNKDGGGYGIPLSYVWDKENRIYIHCAPEGHKLDNLRGDNRVTFTVVGPTQVVPEKFTTAYQSLMAFGTVCLELTDEECREALFLLARKYSPGLEEIAGKYIQGSFHRTTIFCIDIERITAKRKKPPLSP